MALLKPALNESSRQCEASNVRHGRQRFAAVN
jgi:hypothetical protein